MHFLLWALDFMCLVRFPARGGAQRSHEEVDGEQQRSSSLWGNYANRKSPVKSFFKRMWAGVTLRSLLNVAWVGKFTAGG